MQRSDAHARALTCRQYTFPNPPGTLTPDGGKLTPIFSTNFGAETTSPYWHDFGDGTGYLTAVVQHPYGESDVAFANTATSTGPAGWIGFIGPIYLNPSSAVSVSTGLALAAAIAAVAAVLL